MYRSKGISPSSSQQDVLSQSVNDNDKSIAHFGLAPLLAEFKSMSAGDRLKRLMADSSIAELKKNNDFLDQQLAKCKFQFLSTVPPIFEFVLPQALEKINAAIKRHTRARFCIQAPF